MKSESHPDLEHFPPAQQVIITVLPFLKTQNSTHLLGPWLWSSTVPLAHLVSSIKINGCNGKCRRRCNESLEMAEYVERPRAWRVWGSIPRKAFPSFEY